jgi:hypothetical protein
MILDIARNRDEVTDLHNQIRLRHQAQIAHQGEQQVLPRLHGVGLVVALEV